jgi:hypothetical protein
MLDADMACTLLMFLESPDRQFRDSVIAHRLNRSAHKVRSILDQLGAARLVETSLRNRRLSCQLADGATTKVVTTLVETYGQIGLTLLANSIGMPLDLVNAMTGGRTVTQYPSRTRHPRGDPVNSPSDK